MPLNAAPVVVAAFDFDGTLTRSDSLFRFLARGLGWPRFLLALLTCSPWLVAFALRLVRNDVAKARLLRATLAGRSVGELQGWTTAWLAKDFDGQLRDWTMARLAWHKSEGHVCLLVSASLDVYLQSAANQLGFDGLICTQMAVHGGQLTGEMQTPNCYGEQKVVRLKAWLDARFGQLAPENFTLYAYGDTTGDKPMLRMANHAWYRSQPWGGENG
jgi:phosphatidylglycerophosphatase C